MSSKTWRKRRDTQRLWRTDTRREPVEVRPVREHDPCGSHGRAYPSGQDGDSRQVIVINVLL